MTPQAHEKDQHVESGTIQLGTWHRHKQSFFQTPHTHTNSRLLEMMENLIMLTTQERSHYNLQLNLSFSSTVSLSVESKKMHNYY